jgi:hypothetical protein
MLTSWETLIICAVFLNDTDSDNKYMTSYKSLFYFHQRMHYIFAYEYIKIYIKIHIKIAPTYFGLTTILREHIIDLS